MNPVQLVGAGPGAADLLTLRALRALEAAQVVLYDALVSEEILDLCRHARLVPVGKRCGAHSLSQGEINRLLVDAARQAERVVRLKGGDPVLFGRVQEEIDALDRAGLPWEIIPGITAASAAAAQLGISLTCRGEARSVLLATSRVGHGESRPGWAPTQASADTLAIYMGGEETRALSAALIDRGWADETPAAVVVSASRSEGHTRITRLDQLARDGVPKQDGPVLLLLGSVVSRAQGARQSVSWETEVCCEG